MGLRIENPLRASSYIPIIPPLQGGGPPILKVLLILQLLILQVCQSCGDSCWHSQAAFGIPWICMGQKFSLIKHYSSLKLKVSGHE